MRAAVRCAFSALLVAAALAVPAPAAARPDRWTSTADEWRLVFAWRGALYSSRPEGTDLRRLTPDDRRWYGYPAASPDGSRIAFLRYDNPAAGDWDGGLYVMAADGQEPRLLASSSWGEPATGPLVWAPGGRRIAFSRLKERGSGGIPSGECAQVGVVDVTSLREVPFEVTSAVSWSPDAARLVYDTVGDCYEPGAVRVAVRRLGGGRVRVLARGTSPDWAPRGGRIAFVRGGDVFAVRASGGPPRRVTRGKPDDATPRWAPGGARLAFVRDGGQFDMQGRLAGKMVVVRRNGRGLRRIGPADHESVPVWAGSRLAWATDGGIYVGAAGRAGSARRIADGFSPSWVRQ